MLNHHDWDTATHCTKSTLSPPPCNTYLWVTENKLAASSTSSAIWTGITGRSQDLKGQWGIFLTSLTCHWEQQVFMLSDGMGKWPKKDRICILCYAGLIGIICFAAVENVIPLENTTWSPLASCKPAQELRGRCGMSRVESWMGRIGWGEGWGSRIEWGWREQGHQLWSLLNPDPLPRPNLPLSMWNLLVQVWVDILDQHGNF